jgi:hypothetical protein
MLIGSKCEPPSIRLAMAHAQFEVRKQRGERDVFVITAAQAARRALARSDRGTPALHRIITAIGVDPQTQDVWLAIGTLLIHFDRMGQRLASFRTYMPRGARIEASTILVEPDRLLIGADPQGIYEFPRPDKSSQ